MSGITTIQNEDIRRN